MDLTERLAEQSRAWRVVVERTLETDGSLLGFGRRESDAVVLKIVKRPGNEWMSGHVVHAFDGHGMVRVHDYGEGALLLEHLVPGHSLVRMALEGADDTAIDIAADVMTQMAAASRSASCPTVHDWAGGFARYTAGTDRRIPVAVVEEARHWFAALAASQRNARLLHGDLQHYNILFDATRGWLAIDPKGVIAEPEYEIGAMLRNPVERPDLFLSTSTVERRVTRFAHRLNLSAERIIGWGFAQAVLAALWSLEDGFPVAQCDSALRLASAIRPMLPSCP